MTTVMRLGTPGYLEIVAAAERYRAALAGLGTDEDGMSGDCREAFTAARTLLRLLGYPDVDSELEEIKAIAADFGDEATSGLGATSAMTRRKPELDTEKTRGFTISAHRSRRGGDVELWMPLVAAKAEPRRHLVAVAGEWMLWPDAVATVRAKLGEALAYQPPS